ncbi:hypothetical protein BHE74_00016454 [Ensete ventricosum]|nr:hypothetical protein BHE74_00016454 [Ensete ventricosum]
MGYRLTTRRALLGVRSKWQGRTLLKREDAAERALLVQVEKKAAVTTAGAREEEGLAGSCSKCNRDGRRKGAAVVVATTKAATRAVGRGAAAGREEMGYRSMVLAVRCDIAGSISTKEKGNRVMVSLFQWMRLAVAIAVARRKKRLEEEGYDQDLSFDSRKQRMWCPFALRPNLLPRLHLSRVTTLTTNITIKSKFFMRTRNPLRPFTRGLRDVADPITVLPSSLLPRIRADPHVEICDDK